MHLFGTLQVVTGAPGQRAQAARMLNIVLDDPRPGQNASFSDYASPPGSKDHEPMATSRPNARSASTAAPILAAEAPR